MSRPVPLPVVWRWLVPKTCRLSVPSSQKAWPFPSLLCSGTSCWLRSSTQKTLPTNRTSSAPWPPERARSTFVTWPSATPPAHPSTPRGSSLSSHWPTRKKRRAGRMGEQSCAAWGQWPGRSTLKIMGPEENWRPFWPSPMTFSSCWTRRPRPWCSTVPLRTWLAGRWAARRLCGFSTNAEKVCLWGVSVITRRISRRWSNV